MHIVKRTALGIIAFSAVLMLAPLVEAAQDIHVYIEGQNQGHIMGDSTRNGYEDWIDAIEYHHMVEIPAGDTRLRHETIIFTKVLDKSTPSLWRAMDNNEILVDVKFHFWRPSQAGPDEHYYQVQLSGARIVAIEPLSPRNDIPDTAILQVTERIRLSYNTMTVTWMDGGNEHTLSTIPE